jgi:hypothetical protein
MKTFSFASVATQLARLLVGALFVFSGVIKLNDPVGFGYKLEEYFSESVLNLPFWSHLPCFWPFFWWFWRFC